MPTCGRPGLPFFEAGIVTVSAPDKFIFFSAFDVVLVKMLAVFTDVCVHGEASFRLLNRASIAAKGRKNNWLQIVPM